MDPRAITSRVDQLPWELQIRLVYCVLFRMGQTLGLAVSHEASQTIEDALQLLDRWREDPRPAAAKRLARNLVAFRSPVVRADLNVPCTTFMSAVSLALDNVASRSPLGNVIDGTHVVLFYLAAWQVIRTDNPQYEGGPLVVTPARATRARELMLSDPTFVQELTFQLSLLSLAESAEQDGSALFGCLQELPGSALVDRLGLTGT